MTKDKFHTFSREPIIYFIADGKLMVLTRIIDFDNRSAVYAFSDWMAPQNPSKYMSKTKEGSIYQASEDGVQVRKTQTLIRVLRKIRAISDRDREVMVKMWHCLMWPLFLLGISACILFLLPVHLCVMLPVLWFFLLVYLVDKLIGWILK